MDLEKTQQITTEMLPRIPPPLYANQLNVFVLIEYHFGYPIRMDIDQFNDLYTLCNSEADSECRGYIHEQMDLLLNQFKESQAYLGYLYGKEFADVLLKQSISTYKRKGIIKPVELKGKMNSFLRYTYDGQIKPYQAMWKNRIST